MDIDGINYAQWTSQKKTVYSLVFQKFEVARDAITALEDRADSFTEFSSQDSIVKVILEKMTFAEHLDDLKIVSNSNKYLGWSKRVIRPGIEAFARKLDLIPEYPHDEFFYFFDLAEHVNKTFISIEKETKERMKEIEEISERFRNIAQIDES